MNADVDLDETQEAIELEVKKRKRDDVSKELMEGAAQKKKQSEENEFRLRHRYAVVV